MQLEVVWSLLLQTGSEGPALIFYAARLLLGDHLGLPSAPSWRTIVRIANQARLSATTPRNPPVEPEIQHVVQAHVRQLR